ncbi:hypothetical protein [Kribbella sp. NBC_00359]|uniref:hypothetical protein n=1 Tax=Kribbella sp. NBC_00359 TaxID=2975966 RepID=UPI002E1B986D
MRGPDVRIAEVIGIGDVARAADEDTARTAIGPGDAESVVAGLVAGLDTQLGKKFTDGVSSKSADSSGFASSYRSSSRRYVWP